jgi:Flp pilus assembly protein TadG
MQHQGRLLRRQRGALALMFGLALLGLLGMIGFALDLAQLYNRKAELQSLADATALAAARQLTGTPAGVSNALARAADAAADLSYQYNTLRIGWSDAALRFSAAPDGSAPWEDAATALAAPDGLLYVRVDTAALGSAYSRMDTIFMRALSSGLATVSATARATAGRLNIAATPLAICAMSSTHAGERVNPGAPANELVEYGFRRGVGYDLMQLNPNGLTPEHFVIDPLSPPGTPGSAANTADAITGPFVCAGTLQMPRLKGGAITVTRGFPLATLYNHLNSRFDQSAGACSANGAPPDANVKTYEYNGTIPWMSSTRSYQTARQRTTEATKLWTAADPLNSATSYVAGDYGLLWSYAKAVKFSAYSAGVPEPAAGYATFAPANWGTLYAPGMPTALSYPATTPYQPLSGTNFLAPTANPPGLARRRVLNVALLSCPVPAGATVSATVLAIGRFFMTVKATGTTLSAEFAGAVEDQELGGTVELLP